MLNQDVCPKCNQPHDSWVSELEVVVLECAACHHRWRTYNVELFSRQLAAKDAENARLKQESLDAYEAFGKAMKGKDAENQRLRAACDGPLRVCLCGSTRYADAFFAAGWALTLRGQIVLSIGVCKHATDHGAEALGDAAVASLDELHKRKIDLADWVLVLNIGGYYGKSTKGEIEYANRIGKPVVFLYPDMPIPASPPNANCWEDFDQIAQAAREAWDYANHQSFIKRTPGQPLLDERDRLRKANLGLVAACETFASAVDGSQLIKFGGCDHYAMVPEDVEALLSVYRDALAAAKENR